MKFHQAIIRQVAVELLDVTERLYLRAFGWRKVAVDTWLAPDDYPFRRRGYGYHQGHAVNAMKQATHKGKRV